MNCNQQENPEILNWIVRFVNWQSSEWYILFPILIIEILCIYFIFKYIRKMIMK